MKDFGPIQAPPLAADLEYMLQSQQVEDRLLAEELLKGYYGAVRRLAEQALEGSAADQPGAIKGGKRLRIANRLRANLLGANRLGGLSRMGRGGRERKIEPALDVERAVEQVFVRAVANRYTYQPDKTVEAWLFQQAEAALGARINGRSDDPGMRTLTLNQETGDHQVQSDRKGLAERLAEAAQQRRRHAWSPKRVLGTAFTTLMVCAAAWLLLLINTPEAKPVVKNYPMPTSVLPGETVSNFETVSNAEAATFISGILVPERAPYDTVRLEARVHFPEWQSMAPPWYRLEAWIGKDQLLALGGPEGNAPVEGILIKDGVLYRSHQEAGGLRFERVSALSGFLFNMYIFDTLDLLFNGEQNSDLAIVRGQDEMSGRLTWSVKLTNKDTGRQVQVWLDEQTGFIMRYQLLSSSSSAESFGLPDVVQVKMAAFDVSFPQELFDPKQVRDSWGN